MSTAQVSTKFEYLLEDCFNIPRQHTTLWYCHASREQNSRNGVGCGILDPVEVVVRTALPAADNRLAVAAAYSHLCQLFGP